MKNNYIRYITKLGLIVFLFQSQIAISQNNCNTVPCENGTNTNPNPIYTRPQTGDFRQNTFDWRAASFPVNKNGFNSFLPIGSRPYLNPFHREEDYLFGLGFDKLNIGKDNRPEDGWELIKQEFGYAFNNGQWNGSALPIIENNQILAEPSILNYFILYNKYTGVLRILGSYPDKVISKPGIVVHMEIVSPRIAPFSERANYSNYAANGLFALNSPISTALDKQTKNLVISAIAILPPTNAQFFYADFQLSYDPCICLFDGGLRFSFESLLNYDLNVSGLALGSNLRLGNEFGNIFNNRFSSQIAIDKTGVFTTVNTYTANSLTQHFYQVNFFLNFLNNLGFTKDKINELKDNLLKIGELDSIVMLKKAVETISNYIDFASFDEPNVNGKIKTRTISSNIMFTGNVISKEIIGSEFYIGTPGSCGAENRDEYTRLNTNGTIPMYPMYNEPLGLSAMLYTPRIYRTLIADRIDDCGNCKKSSSKRCRRKCNSNSSKKVRRVENLQEFYKLENNSVKLAFHPLIDTEKTQVDAAIEIFGIDDLVVESDKNHFLDKTTLHCSKLDELDGIGRYRTSFLPLQCIDELVFGVGHSFFGNKKRHKEFFTKARSKSYLVLNIYYVFKEDVYGNVHTGVQTIKYPLEIIESLEDLSNHPNINFFAGKELKDSICNDKPKTYISSNSELTIFCKSDSYRAKDVNLESNKPEEQKENILIASKNIASIYPNPSDGTFAILFENKTIANHTLTIIDPLGREVYKQVLDRGNQNFEIQRSNLPTGVYLLSITHACEKQTFKIIIQ
jgi:hypothetical protein